MRLGEEIQHKIHVRTLRKITKQEVKSQMTQAEYAAGTLGWR